MPDGFFRALCVIAFAVPLGAIGFILAGTKIDKNRSTSLHIGRSRRDFLLFAVASTISIASMAGFLWWLVPRLQLSIWFDIVAALVLIGYFLTAWSRYQGQGEWDFHSVCAYITAGLIPLFTSCFLATDLPLGIKLAIGLAVAWMGGCLFLLIMPHTRLHYLPVQLSYLGMLCASMLIVAFAA